MTLQYLTDVTGQYTGVFIPIKEWERLTTKFSDLERELDIIPEWHKKILDERLADYEKNPEQVLDFNAVMDEIEKKLWFINLS